MGISTFSGPVKSQNGFLSMGPGAVVNVTAADTLTPATYAGRVIRTNTASMTLTLPTIVASADDAIAGPGSDPNNPSNIGASYTIFVETLASALKIIAGGSDKLVGHVTIMDGAAAVTGYASDPTASVSLTMNGTTKGGIVGSWVTFTAVASAKWMVTGALIGSGTIATPFAAS